MSDWDKDWELEKARNARRANNGNAMDVDVDVGGRARRRSLDLDELMDDVAPAVAEATPLEELMRHWMNERHAPTILPAREQLLGRLLDHIRRQTDTVQALRGDPSTSEEDHIRIMLVQTEVERVKFIVRSYIRTRLFKIEQFARFISQDAPTQALLTQAELKFAISLTRTTDRHFHASVLQSLPPAQADLEDTHAFEPPMTTEPNKQRAVFAYARKACPPVKLPNGIQMDVDKDQLTLVPYWVVEDLVLAGDVDLV